MARFRRSVVTVLVSGHGLFSFHRHLGCMGKHRQMFADAGGKIWPKPSDRLWHLLHNTDLSRNLLMHPQGLKRGDNHNNRHQQKKYMQLVRHHSQDHERQRPGSN